MNNFILSIKKLQGVDAGVFFIYIPENLGVGSGIRFYQFGEAPPAFTAFPFTSGFHSKSQNLEIDGWWVVELEVAGEVVSLITFYYSLDMISEYGLELYTTGIPTGLRVQVTKYNGNTSEDFLISLNYEPFRLDQPNGNGNTLYNYYSPLTGVENFSSIRAQKEGQFAGVPVYYFNYTLSTDPPPPGLPDWTFEDPEPDPEPTPDTDPEVETNVVLFGPIFYSRNHVLFASSAAPGWGALTNVRVRNDVRIETEEGSDEFTSVLKVDLPPESTGAVNYQVRSAFRGHLTAQPPAAGANTIIELNDRIKNFKHNIATLSADQTEPVGGYAASAVQRVMWGGLSKRAFKEVNFFATYLPSTRMFLTWAPDEKFVDRTQEDYVNYFVFNTLTTQVKLCAQIFYTDGTSRRETLMTKTVIGGQLLQVPAGPTNTGINVIDVTKVVSHYRLYLTNQNNKLISNIKLYRINEVSPSSGRIIMFLNSLGAYETHRFIGKSANQADVEKQTITKLLPIDYSATDGEHQVNTSWMNSKTTVNTGYLITREWLAYYKDLLLSSRVFDITNGARVPVIIEAGSFDLDQDQNYEHFLEFTISEAYTEENFTPAL